jgi:indole-3-glycerol phosphate synthase
MPQLQCRTILLSLSGVQAVLVGEALMRSGDPAAALRALRSARS